jgi:transposase-like protein
MPPTRAAFAPPFCPNSRCEGHADPVGWRYKRAGFFTRHARPHRIQRYRCSRCGRSFSSQTFSTTYWLRHPELPRAVFLRLLACSAYRQIARDLGHSPTTVQRQAERLGRHCLLFHERMRPKGPLAEPLVLDGFESFEFSQYTPIHLHAAAGQASHFFYGFTDSELRRKGRMTDVQRRRRAELERRFGRPDPQAIERDVAELLAIVTAAGTRVELHTDDHPAYPRALRSVGGGRRFDHRVTPGRASRTVRNPLFAVNLLDLLIRHSSANHKRETIAFSKRRQGAIDRLWVFAVWRNAIKSWSERRRDASPAQRLGLLPRRLTAEDVLAERLFPSRIPLPVRWATYYWRRVPTRRISVIRTHAAVYAV